jgi:hypothetical protein
MKVKKQTNIESGGQQNCRGRIGMSPGCCPGTNFSTAYYQGADDESGQRIKAKLQGGII